MLGAAIVITRPGRQKEPTYATVRGGRIPSSRVVKFQKLWLC
jgi:hypothetical protein